MKIIGLNKNEIGVTNGNFSKCIIDVGTSYNAPRGKFFKKKLKLPCIYIDADRQSLNKLKIDKDDLKLNVAISSTPGLAQFNYYQPGTHSLLETNLQDITKYIDGYTGKPAIKGNWAPVKKEYIPKITINNIVTEMRIDSIEVLKIDTQGHDFEVIKGCGESLNVTKYIELEVQTTEFEIYQGQSKKNELLDYMEKKGFELVRTEIQTYGQEENLIFINKNLSTKDKDKYLEMIK